LRVQAQTALLTVERERAGMQLKAVMETLEKEIREQREASRSISIVDIAELYRVAGRTRDEALGEARRDFEDTARAVKVVEERIAEFRADVVYGFSER
ncbi:hypothetical protein BU26DRAFT_409813, partial [Trematosphaeria pertusa]